MLHKTLKHKYVKTTPVLRPFTETEVYYIYLEDLGREEQI